MASINLSFTTTAAQDAKLAKLLAKVNADRAGQMPALPPFADLQSWLRDVVIQTVTGYVRAQSLAEKDDVATAYDAADATKQAAARAALGIV